MFAVIIMAMGNRIENKLFRLSERIIELREQESVTSAELEMLRSLDDDFQRDAAVSGHPSDRSDARAHADVERFERVLAGLAARRGGWSRSGSPPRPARRRLSGSQGQRHHLTDGLDANARPARRSQPRLSPHCLPTGDAIGPDDQLGVRVHRMLLKLVSEHHPDGIAIAWDVGRDTFGSPSTSITRQPEQRPGSVPLPASADLVR